MSHNRVFIGVDLTAGKRPITCVTLSARRNITANANTDFDGALEIATQYEQVVCAVDAPQSHNAGLMADPEYRAHLKPRPNRTSYSNYRVCEYQLKRRGIGLYNTPRDAITAPGWMQLGWRFFDALREAGFAAWPGSADRLFLEVHPHACFTALLGHHPFKKTPLEGRLQRQLVLYRAGVGVPDPIAALEELTPHRLVMGDLRMGGLLYDHDALDAVAAAYTAWLAANRSDEVTAVGDAGEGVIVVPVGALKEKYGKPEKV